MKYNSYFLILINSQLPHARSHTPEPFVAIFVCNESAADLVHQGLVILVRVDLRQLLGQHFTCVLAWVIGHDLGAISRMSFVSS